MISGYVFSTNDTKLVWDTFFIKNVILVENNEDMSRT